MARGASTAAKDSGSMPGKKRPTETYESDGSFVVNDGSDTNAEPKTKKFKKEPKDKRKIAVNGKTAKEEQFWELSGRRRVSISEYYGKTMVNIREYYEKDGELLPGKKGISLPTHQFNAFLTLLPELEAALAARGETVERPAYNERPIPSTDGADDEHDAEDRAEGQHEDEQPSTKGAEKSKSKKKNFEETSEEGE